MLTTVRQIIGLLSPRERRRFAILVGMILMMGLLEAAGIASIFPFLIVLSDPTAIETNEYLAKAYALSGLQDPHDFLIALGGAVFFVVVVGLAFKTLTMYAVMRFGHMRNYTLGLNRFKSYLGRPYHWFLSHHSAHLAKNILAEVDEVVRGAIIPIAYILSYGVILVCITAVIVIADPIVALSAAGVVGGCYLVISMLTRNMLLGLGRDRELANQQRFHVLHECFGGIKYVKLRHLERAFTGRFNTSAIRLASYRAKGEILSETPKFIVEGLLIGGIMMVILVKLTTTGGNFAESMPVIGLFAFAGVRLFPAAQRVYRGVAQLRFGHHALQSLIRDLEDAPPGTVTADFAGNTDAEPLRMRESVKFERVCFSYPSSNLRVLEDLSFEIKAHTTVAFVGKTGSGKTTIIDLILGMLEPKSGKIVVDGVTIDREILERWQSSLGYVPQDIFLSDDTIRGNIAFGVRADKIDHEAVERSARMAELHDFVANHLEDGYDTQVGERGVRLSGGQCQRIGIARALYHNPDILVLDEATSALDGETERAVMDAVHNLSKAKTIILVAHRLSTVRQADKIFLLDQGVVSASGTYEELMTESESFKSMAGNAS